MNSWNDWIGELWFRLGLATNNLKPNFYFSHFTNSLVISRNPWFHEFIVNIHLAHRNISKQSAETHDSLVPQHSHSFLDAVNSSRDVTEIISTECFLFRTECAVIRRRQLQVTTTTTTTTTTATTTTTTTTNAFCSALNVQWSDDVNCRSPLQQQQLQLQLLQLQLLQTLSVPHWTCSDQTTSTAGHHYNNNNYNYNCNYYNYNYYKRLLFRTERAVIRRRQLQVTTTTTTTTTATTTTTTTTNAFCSALNVQWSDNVNCRSPLQQQQ